MRTQEQKAAIREAAYRMQMRDDEDSLVERIVLALLVGTFVLIAGAQAYRAGQRSGRQAGFSTGYEAACHWADNQYASRSNDEVGALCMESEPDEGAK